MKYSLYSLLLSACSLLPVCTSAQELPLWEVGVGLGVLELPDYRGSEKNRTYALPFPYITYRGEHVSIDEGGAHGQLFKSEDIRLELSLAGGIPVISDDDGPRAGMPDLDPTVEFGPSLEFRLWHQPKQEVWLKFPIRSSLSVNDTNLKHEGWSHSPYIEYTMERGNPNYWKISVAVGPIYADEEYHNYFYEVEPAYATPGRMEYHSESGYSGSRITLTLQKNIGDVWFGAFMRFDEISNTAFEDSPLVTTNQYLAVGLATSWVFAKSSTLVDVSD